MNEPPDLATLVGPFYDEGGTVGFLGIDTAELRRRIRANQILGLQTGSGEWVFPTWQFTANGTTVPGLADVLSALATGTSEGWMWALWLVAPNADWDELCAWQWLAAGRSGDVVLDEAQRDAARWRQ